MKVPHTLIVGGIFIIHFVLIALFFDPKAHLGGDDSDYIVAAADFLSGTAFPSWHGSFYPIFLSAFIACFGINLILLKVVSVVISILSAFIVYKTFYKRVPDAVLYFTMTITCFCYYIVLYSSTTYSEPLFLLVQSLIFYYFFRSQDSALQSSPHRLFQIISILAVFTFLLSITRNVGWGTWIALSIYFIIAKRWKETLIFSGVFGVFHALFFLYKRVVWEVATVGVEGQFGRIAYKNFYNAENGTEDAWGFVVRFWQNSQMYLSKYLATMLGIRSLGVGSTSAVLTILFYLAFILTAILIYKKSRVLFTIPLYLAIMLGITFITQQTHWDQVRLILIYLPFICLALGFVIHQAATVKFKLVSYVAKALLICLPCLVLFRTLAADNNLDVTISNLTGEPFKGYPEEWKNYVALSEWAGQNVEEDKNILCRKPGLSTVYGKRNFLGISRFTAKVADSADQFLLRKKIDFVIFDRLPLGTVRRLVSYYITKRPLGLRVRHVQGNNPKSSSLLEIVRTPPEDDKDYLNRVSAGQLVLPDNPYYYTLAGDKYFLMKDFPKAISFYSHALTLTKEDEQKTFTCMNRGKAFMNLKKWENAREDITFALSQRPDNQEAKQLLQYIDFFQKNGK